MPPAAAISVMILLLAMPLSAQVPVSERPGELGGHRSCVIPSDRPPLPDGFTPPAGALESDPNPSEPTDIVYREYIGIRFDDCTGGARMNAILGKYGATIVGGSHVSGEYYVRIPDPGPTTASYDSVIRSIGAEEGVEYVGGVSASSPFNAR